MDGESLRRARRRKNLTALLEEIGKKAEGEKIANPAARGAVQAEIDTGTPRTHFVAMVTGRRGLGDSLAEKLERIYGKPAGWFDAEPDTGMWWPFSVQLQEALMRMAPDDLERIEVAIWARLPSPMPDELRYAPAPAERRAQQEKPRPPTIAPVEPPALTAERDRKF